MTARAVAGRSVALAVAYTVAVLDDGQAQLVALVPADRWLSGPFGDHGSSPWGLLALRGP